jgi:drug/metabolite transporter (DMT)-like permease
VKDTAREEATPKPTGGPQPLGPVAIGLVILTAALWGGTPTAVKFTTAALPPIAISGIRFGLAAVFMVFWCLVERSELRLRKGQLWPCVGAGAFLFVQIGLFTIAIDRSNASHSTLCINTFIFWVLLIEHFLTRHDRLTGAKLLGLVIAVAGVLLIVSTSAAPEGATGTNPDDPELAGDLLMLVSAFVLAVKVVFTKWATKSVEPGKLIFWHDVFGTLGFVVASLMFEEVSTAGIDGPVILGLLYQGIVVGGFCFAVQTTLLKKHSASQITVFSFLTPLFGTLFAVTFRDDVLSPWLYTAGGCIAVGILLVTRANGRGPRLPLQSLGD